MITATAAAAANDNALPVLLLTDVVDAVALDRQRLTHASGWVNGVSTRPQPKPLQDDDSFWRR